MNILIIIIIITGFISSLKNIKFTKKQYIENNKRIMNNLITASKISDTIVFSSTFFVFSKLCIEFFVLFYVVIHIKSYFLLIVTLVFLLDSIYNMLSISVNMYLFGIEDTVKLKIERCNLLSQYIPLIYIIIFTFISINWMLL